MIKSLIRPFRQPTPAEMRILELDKTRRELLSQQAAAEYHAGMVEVLKKRMRRLEASD